MAPTRRGPQRPHGTPTRQSSRSQATGHITTDIVDAPEFYFAEDYHQQYLAKNPNGYCPDHSTGVSCPVGLGVKAAG